MLSGPSWGSRIRACDDNARVKAVCVQPLRHTPKIYQDAAFSIDLPTDLSFQLEGVRIELTTHSLTMNLLQASFLSYIYIITKILIFFKKEN